MNRRQIIAEIERQSAAAHADAAVVLAVVEQETGNTFNPKAVGDHGTSFGLRMLHKGGQLGAHSSRWAQNPAHSIPEAVAALGGAHTAAAATKIQNPANPAAYQKTLATKISAWRKKLGTAAVPAATPTLTTHVMPGGILYKYSPLRDEIRRMAPRYGVTWSDGDRSPNAGYGAPNSDHSTDKPGVWADDYTGPVSNLTTFYLAVLTRYRLQLKSLLPVGHAYSTGPNVHVAGYSSRPSAAVVADNHAALVGPSNSGGIGAQIGDAINGVVPGTGDIAGQVASAVGPPLITAGVVTVLLVAGVALVVFGVLHTTGASKIPTFKGIPK